jgi:hypothetical protein
VCHIVALFTLLCLRTGRPRNLLISAPRGEGGRTDPPQHTVTPSQPRVLVGQIRADRTHSLRACAGPTPHHIPGVAAAPGTAYPI